jgi:hypothetical protein
MGEVVRNRLTVPRHRIEGFAPRRDVEGFIAVRNADAWRIGENWRARVVFRLPDGSYTPPIWLQPADYQQARHMTSSRCRVETSEALARAWGWSYYAHGRGRTTAYIVRWER